MEIAIKMNEEELEFLLYEVLPIAAYNRGPACQADLHGIVRDWEKQAEEQGWVRTFEPVKGEQS